MAKDKGKVFQDKNQLIGVLNQLRTESENKGRTEFAQSIVQLIQDLNDNKRDVSEVSIKGRVKIKKFNGPKLPESIPVEIQEFITEA